MKPRKVWYYNPIDGRLQYRTAYYYAVAHDRQGEEIGEEWYVKDEGTDKRGMSGTLNVDWLFTSKDRALAWGLAKHLATIQDALDKIKGLTAASVGVRE